MRVKLSSPCVRDQRNDQIVSSKCGTRLSESYCVSDTTRLIFRLHMHRRGETKQANTHMDKCQAKGLRKRFPPDQQPTGPTNNAMRKMGQNLVLLFGLIAMSWRGLAKGEKRRAITEKCFVSRSQAGALHFNKCKVLLEGKIPTRESQTDFAPTMCSPEGTGDYWPLLGEIWK